MDALQKGKVVRRMLPAPIKRGIKQVVQALRNRYARGFYDPNDFPFVPSLEAEWRTIRNELEALENRYFVECPDTPHQGNWSVFGLLGAGKKIDENCELCPETTRIIDSIPDLKVAAFMSLAPGARVARHVDTTKSLMRCSLTLKSPDACKIRVGREIRGWEEGKCFVFNPNIEHEVWNDGSSPRVVLWLGVVKHGMVHDERDNQRLEMVISETKNRNAVKSVEA